MPIGPVDMAALARTTVEDLQPLAAAKSIALRIDAPAEARLVGHEDALRIQLTNLVDNAIRYTSAGGHVDVSVQAADGQVQVSVLDTGPGIPADERERVFDRFYRGRETASGGSGLGLAIVRQIAEMHGVRVSLDGREGGTGLRATVTYPSP
jgi:two-component system OmpR family sensor kinase